MKRITILFSTIVFAFFFVGCEEKFDIDLDDIPPAIVIEGRLTNGNLQNFVRVSMSTPYLSDGYPEYIAGALVTITEDGVLTDTLTPYADFPGQYESIFFGNAKIGSTYKLRVEYGGEVYEAEDMIRPVTPIDSLTYTYEDELGDENDGYYVWLHAQEPAGLGNNYQWFYISKRAGVINAFHNDWLANDEWVDGNYISLKFDMDEPQMVGDTVIVEIAGISPQYYTFMTQVMNQESFGDLFDTPPANVKGNLSNGAYGYFHTAGVVMDSIAIE